MLKTAALT